MPDVTGCSRGAVVRSRISMLISVVEVVPKATTYPI
jgi:hypothetical protein